MRDRPAHVWPVRVYYEDTDAGGVVYHANYLRFAERARTEMLRRVGFDHLMLDDRYGGALVVRHLKADFLLPARLDDALEVRTWVNHVGGASLELDQAIVCNGRLSVEIACRLAWIGAGRRATRLPPVVRAAFTDALKDTER